MTQSNCVRARLAPLFLACAAASAALLAICVHANPVSGAEGGFSSYTVKPPGTLKECLRGDFNGDGLADLAAVCLREEGAKQAMHFSVFLQRKGAGFAENPDTQGAFPDGSAAACCADVLGGREDEIVVMTKDGVGAFVGLAGPSPPVFTRIFSGRTFFKNAPSGSILAMDFARDLNGDGRADLIIPQQGGYLLAFQAADRSMGMMKAVQAAGESKIVRHTNQIFETEFIHLKSTLPILRPADFDGDGLLDLVALQKPMLWVFIQQKDAGFPLKPTVSMRLPFMDQKTRPTETDMFESKVVRIEDVNRDGRCDLIYSSTHGKIGIFSSIATTYALFLGRKDAFYADLPDRLINIPGVALVPDFIDYDGDGDLDLLVGSVRTDLFQGVKAAIAEEVTVTYFMFLCKDGLWEQSPAFEEKVTFPTSMIDRGELAPRAMFSGDWNGDGFRDKVEVTEESVMRFFAGRVEEGEWGFADSPFAETKADVSADLEVLDLNLDRKSDAIFYHPDRISVVMSGR